MANGFGYEIGEQIGSGIGSLIGSSLANRSRRNRKKEEEIEWAKRAGIDRDDPDVFKAISEGKMDRAAAESAIRLKKQTAESKQKTSDDAEAAADEFFKKQEKTKTEAANAEAQMNIRRDEEVALNAAGSFRGTPPALHGRTAANVADETEPSQQFSMRSKLKADAEKAADQFYLQNEKSMTPGAAGAVVRNVVTPKQAGLPEPEMPQKPKAVRPAAQAKSLVSTEKVQSIYQAHFKRLRDAVPDDNPFDEDRIHQQAMASTAKEVERLTEVSGGGNYDAIVADLEAQIQEAIEDLQRLKQQ
jgi:hypothetical protein